MVELVSVDKKKKRLKNRDLHDSWAKESRILVKLAKLRLVTSTLMPTRLAHIIYTQIKMGVRPKVG